MSIPLKYSLLFVAIIAIVGVLEFFLPTIQTDFISTGHTVIQSVASKLLVALLVTLLCVGTWKQERRATLSFTLGSIVGLLFFINVLGVKLVDPTYIEWVMRGDWAAHYIGWCFFRQEAWQWPVGKMSHFLYPIGTSIGYADALPLFAIPLKLFHTWLPKDFQYIGIWLLLCYCLQGGFAALLLRLVTPHLGLQTLGAAVFVFSPVLLHRIAHENLTAHWLLLAGIFLYFKDWSAHRTGIPFVAWLTLASVSALIHPYLTVMVLGITTAFYLRYSLVEQQYTIMSAIMQLSLISIGVIALWWLCGYFLVTDKASLTSIKLGHYSMNLLAPLNSMGAGSVLFRDIPLATEGQYEGFNYLGAGVILLGLWTIYELNRYPAHTLTFKRWLPLGIICLIFALIAVSTKVTIANIVLLDLQSSIFDVLANFRASGRFFWVAYYVLIFLILSVLIVRHHSRTAFIYLSLGLAIQWVDLYAPYVHHRNLRDTPALYWNPDLPEWKNPLQSPLWHTAATHYQHLTLLPPLICSPRILEFYMSLTYFAAQHGLTVNSGYVARVDGKQWGQYCQTLTESLAQGTVNDNELYVMLPESVSLFTQNAQKPVLCQVVDGFALCATAESYNRWKEQ